MEFSLRSIRLNTVRAINHHQKALLDRGLLQLLGKSVCPSVPTLYYYFPVNGRHTNVSTA